MNRKFDRVVLLLHAVAFSLVGLAMVDFLLHPLAVDAIFHSALYRAIVVLALIPANLLVGLLIIRRVPGNIIGRLFIVWCGTVAYWSLRAEIAPVLFALFVYFDFFGWMALFSILLHFPDGTIEPPRAMRWVYPLFAITLLMTTIIFLSWPTFPVPSQIPNPFYQHALQPYAAVINGPATLVVVPIVLLTLVSPVLRYRKGNQRRRQQIKWLALFAGFFTLYVLLIGIIIPLLTGGEVMNPGTELPGLLFYLTTALFPPVAIGIAILRHSLWDIDLFIRRTLVYSLLTGVLTLVYFGSVLVLQALSQLITTQQQPPLVTVLSTLTIAALFSPVRRRIQIFIDRRFYRRKYNAEKVLAALASTLREEVSLDRLTNSVLNVVEETVEPTHVSLWLADSGAQPAELH